MNIPPRMVRVIFVDGDDVLPGGGLCTLVEFVKKWKRFSKLDIGDWVSEPRPWFGIVDEAGQSACLFEAKPGTRAAGFAAKQDALIAGKFFSVMIVSRDGTRHEISRQTLEQLQLQFPALDVQAEAEKSAAHSQRSGPRARPIDPVTNLKRRLAKLARKAVLP